MMHRAAPVVRSDDAARSREADHRWWRASPAARPRRTTLNGSGAGAAAPPPFHRRHSCIATTIRTHWPPR
ncbi:hypothetical protein BURCENBC7_AP0036 [Burkholderia cenocepacia BC7]|nr:hypothetical protein BURCENBC7_AP0036 [Burkholderia cenocepacia BC7]